MLTEWELCACANATIAQHGEGAALFVAERLGALALAGDVEGIRVWKEIARRIDEMQRRALPH